MATTPPRSAHAPKERMRQDLSDGFDVTCVVGRVQFDANGDMPPHVAAMRLIAEHDAEGTYCFPMRDGRTCAVTVEWTGDIARA